MDEGKISIHLNIIYFSNIGNLEVSAYKITENLIVIVLKFQESIKLISLLPVAGPILRVLICKLAKPFSIR